MLSPGYRLLVVNDVIMISLLLFKVIPSVATLYLVAREARVVLASCKNRCPINLSMNICLVSANDVMEHFAFPGNIDFAADDQGSFSCIIHERLLRLFIVCETMFTIGESRTISNANDTQAKQVAPNPRRGRFSTETPLE